MTSVRMIIESPQGDTELYLEARSAATDVADLINRIAERARAVYGTTKGD